MTLLNLKSIKHFLGLVLCPALSLLLLASSSHATPVFEPLQAFALGPAQPQSKLVQASDGNFYGTTYVGGSNDSGTVFKMTPAGSLTTLVNFNGTNGSHPSSALLEGVDGNLYGTTIYGGSGDSTGFGTVFKVTTSGILTTLVDFSDLDSGAPACLLLGRDGDFYGTTAYGGSNQYGTLFKMTASGSLTTLVNFHGQNDRHSAVNLTQGSDGDFYGTAIYGTTNSGDENSIGRGTAFKITANGDLTILAYLQGDDPSALIQGNDGNLYGTTRSGSHLTGSGTAYKMTPEGELTILAEFSDHATGRYPVGELAQASDGELYGTTSVGGSGDNGTVFKITSTGTHATLVNFTGANGATPISGLLLGRDGSLYGTTPGGGNCGNGTAFKMTTTGTLTTLVDFAPTMGSFPAAELLHGRDGNFYGTTYSGGSSDLGTVFKMTLSGSLTTLVHFDLANGSRPTAKLVQGSDGNFYGITSEGGSSGQKGGSPGFGTVFKMTASGMLTTLIHFDGANGINPDSLIQASDRNLYGTTARGGSNDYGTVFKMSTSGKFSTLIHFNESNGSLPSSLMRAKDGNFYGTTHLGASSRFGTIFKMTPSGSLATLVNFDDNDTNGGFPKNALLQARDGNFYGTINSIQYGSIFKMTPSGTFTTLAGFDETSGGQPYSSLVQGKNGNFYGTAYRGDIYKHGTVFMMTPSGILTTIVNFTGENGSTPIAGLTQGSDGHLYGTTSEGGSTPDGQFAGGGQIYRLRIGPRVTSLSASNIVDHSVTLNGTVNPGGYATEVFFQYATNPTLANSKFAHAGKLRAGITDLSVKVSISRLLPGKTYYYRVLARNEENAVPQYGSILSFQSARARLRPIWLTK